MELSKGKKDEGWTGGEGKTGKKWEVAGGTGTRTDYRASVTYFRVNNNGWDLNLDNEADNSASSTINYLIGGK